MKAVVLHEFGGPENLKLEEVPEPRVDPREVLIRVRACGVCYHDLITREGHQPHTKLPTILGHEISGEVEEVGSEVQWFRRGDRVATVQQVTCGRCALCRSGRETLCRSGAGFFGEEIPGGNAAYVKAEEQAVSKLPAAIPFDQGAILACTLGTALHVAERRAKIQPGETVLLTGASGGVGLHSIQVLKLLEARVIAVTTSEQKVEALRSAGADEVILATDLRFSREVKRLTEGRGVDVVLDILGRLSFEEGIKSMAAGGRFVFVGNLFVEPISIKPGLIILKEITLSGSYATTIQELDRAARLTVEGKVKPVVSGRLPLEEAAQAHRMLRERRVVGRLVLTV